ncbi:MAG: hypothetical protein PCFJNLEI_01101 [Verrucomicrobiae bacterium]|nr:hypothetical protein [Verrucomicrobiae bacterium]
MKTIRSFSAGLALTFVVTGCNRSEEKTPPIAPVPAAAPAPAKTELPPGHPPLKTELPAGHPPIDMSQQTLPANTLSDAANPTWEVPAGWQPGKPSSMRRATYIVKGADDKTAELAVTVFPGDVGGLVANVNRWRGQLGLPPATPEEIAKFTTELTVAGAPSTLVEFTNPQTGQRMAVVTAPHAGSSWFYKLTGPAAVVEATKADLVKFVQSTKF